MNLYRVRVRTVGAIGFFTQADHYHDYNLEASESLGDFARHLADNGFQDSKSGRWIMPAAIVWIDKIEP
jgi:hypothetical protein